MQRQALALGLASKLEKLSASQGDAVRMRYIQGMTIAEISNYMPMARAFNMHLPAIPQLVVSQLNKMESFQ